MANLKRKVVALLCALMILAASFAVTGCGKKTPVQKKTPTKQKVPDME